jgi:hypothetical protein
MKYICISIFALLLSQNSIADEKDDLCPILTKYIDSIGVDQKTTIELHTSWGSNFNDDSDDVFAAKRCIRDESSSAKELCSYLMKNSSTEFAGINFKRFLSCLSPKSKIDINVYVNLASIELSYGNEDRGASIELSLEDDEKIGGMVLKMEAEGY